MYKIKLIIVTFLTVFCCVSIAQNTAPEVEITEITQSGISTEKIVTVFFNFRDVDHDPLTVKLNVSTDAGATWDTELARTLSGDTFVMASPSWQFGAITWLAGQDWPDQFSDQMKIEIVVDDIQGGLYLVVDVSLGPTSDYYPFQFFEEEPIDLLTNNVYKTSKIILRHIPSGVFAMGSPSFELGHESDETIHTVTLTTDFYIGVFEVTQKQWELVVGDFTGDSRPMRRRWDHIRGTRNTSSVPQGDSFIERLIDRTGLIFELPTEAQWEFACRAGTTTALNSGKNLISEENDPNMNQVGLYKFNGGNNGTGAVGAFIPNAWGLYDMHGNVSEWCLDEYKSNLGTLPLTNPITNGSSSKTIRGGAYNQNANQCRSASRSLSNYSSSNSGFRISGSVF